MTGSRLAIGGLAFLFGSFVFAYFYLRSLDSEGRWRSRYIPAPSFVEQPPTYTDTYLVQRFQASLSAFSSIWNFLALMALLFWLLFYAL